MITLNLKNVEEILFKNHELKKLFPEFKHYFEQWGLSQQYNFLKQMGKQAMIDLLDNLNSNHLELISNYLNVDIVVNKLNYKTIKEYEFDINNISDEINKIEDQGNLFLYRNNTQIYICTWR